LHDNVLSGLRAIRVGAQAHARVLIHHRENPEPARPSAPADRSRNPCSSADLALLAPAAEPADGRCVSFVSSYARSYFPRDRSGTRAWCSPSILRAAASRSTAGSRSAVRADLSGHSWSVSELPRWRQ
jgi:hypothetical protein